MSYHKPLYNKKLPSLPPFAPDLKKILNKSKLDKDSQELFKKYFSDFNNKYKNTSMVITEEIILEFFEPLCDKISEKNNLREKEKGKLLKIVNSYAKRPYDIMNNLLDMCKKLVEKTSKIKPKISDINRQKLTENIKKQLSEHNQADEEQYKKDVDKTIENSILKTSDGFAGTYKALYNIIPTDNTTIAKNVLISRIKILLENKEISKSGAKLIAKDLNNMIPKSINSTTQLLDLLKEFLKSVKKQIDEEKKYIADKTEALINDLEKATTYLNDAKFDHAAAVGPLIKPFADYIANNQRKLYSTSAFYFKKYKEIIPKYAKAYDSFKKAYNDYEKTKGDKTYKASCKAYDRLYKEYTTFNNLTTKLLNNVKENEAPATDYGHVAAVAVPEVRKKLEELNTALYNFTKKQDPKTLSK